VVFIGMDKTASGRRSNFAKDHSTPQPARLRTGSNVTNCGNGVEFKLRWDLSAAQGWAPASLLHAVFGNVLSGMMGCVWVLRARECVCREGSSRIQKQRPCVFTRLSLSRIVSHRAAPGRYRTANGTSPVNRRARACGGGFAGVGWRRGGGERGEQRKGHSTQPNTSSTPFTLRAGSTAPMRGPLGSKIGAHGWVGSIGSTVHRLLTYLISRNIPIEYQASTIFVVFRAAGQGEGPHLP